MKRTLTDKQREVIIMLANGASHQECHAALGKSDTAIKSRLNTARMRLGAASVTNLVVLALINHEIAENDIIRPRSMECSEAPGLRLKHNEKQV